MIQTLPYFFIDKFKENTRSGDLKFTVDFRAN